mmetsp:Transcript_13502/g.26496  ORF Transcript_13502/g.26496 Transcript_13502/m.26496 type:complete len:192 (-) Transcript_13502:158-733(-)
MVSVLTILSLCMLCNVRADQTDWPKLPSLGNLLKGLFKTKPRPIKLPKPWKETEMGKILTSEAPAGDSYPPRHLNYEGSRYARRYVRDAPLPPSEANKLIQQPQDSGNEKVPPDKSAKSTATTGSSEGKDENAGEEETVFPIAYHVLPEPNEPVSNNQKRHQQQKLSSGQAMDPWRVFGSAPLIMHNVYPE